MAAVIEALLVLICKQVVSCPQQKFGGKSLGHWLRLGLIEQVPASCLGNSVRPSFGLNSSGVHNALADAAEMKYGIVTASANMRRHVECIITMRCVA